MSTFFSTNVATSSKILWPSWVELEDETDGVNGEPLGLNAGADVSNANIAILTVELGTASSVDIRFWGIPYRNDSWFVLQDSSVTGIDVNTMIKVDLSTISRIYCEITASDGTVTLSLGASS